ncbi:MAG TPA: site-2 protease family protein [Bryobacteraceae bacterium]|nr:site-2 protease family protein [Bryobacteraceae bacterium]
MSSQDFSPAPYPSCAEDGAGAADLTTEVRVRERYWLYALLFLLTLFTTTVVGAAMQFDFAHNIPFDVEHNFDALTRLWAQPAGLLAGLPFSLTLMAILLAHEFGHYLTCMFYRVDASLPYFLPAPTLIGTFGAFIRIRSAIYSRRILFDIGIAGPLAGFVFLLPALSVGLAFSKVIPGIGHVDTIHFGVPALQWLLEKAIFPGVPIGDIYLHPVARAAWIGILATALNLLPIGQLDGGHILYALAGDRHKLVSRIAIAALIPLGIFFWWVWLFWAAVLFWLGRRHPAIYDSSDLGPGRRRLGWIAMAIFVLCFTVAPVGTSGF